jgi:hypothetical protein
MGENTTLTQMLGNCSSSFPVIQISVVLPPSSLLTQLCHFFSVCYFGPFLTHSQAAILLCFKVIIILVKRINCVQDYVPFSSAPPPLLQVATFMISFFNFLPKNSQPITAHLHVHDLTRNITLSDI